MRTSNNFNSVRSYNLLYILFILVIIMANEKFILLNLEDQQSKDLAQVISSDTARKILNLLSEKSYAETDISSKLNIPLSTVHYNVQALLKSNVIEVHDFLWSEKGKKINIYKLANKLIIIAPKKQENDSLKEKLRSIIPAALVGLIGTISIFIYQNLYLPSTIQTKTFLSATLEKSFTSDIPMKSYNYFSWHLDTAFIFFSGVLIVVLFFILSNAIRKNK